MFQIAPFFITNANLMSFKRLVAKPNDCVINALQLLNILDEKAAHLMRIAVGDIGLTEDQIQETFSYIYPSFEWRFIRYTNIKTLENYCFSELQPSHVIFCGYKKNYFRHVFLIGKDQNNTVVYIDPQINTFCDLKRADCFHFIRDASEYYILQCTANAMQIQQQIQKLI
jgi:hypothetical protein